VNANEFPHSYFITRRICEISQNNTVGNYYSTLKIKCDWNKFVDSAKDPARFKLDEAKKNSLRLFYEFEFTTAVKSNDPTFQRVAKIHFTNFNVKSLSMKNLGLTSIDQDTFTKENFGSEFHTLDLSNNNLKRLDKKTLENLSGLNKLFLANNRLSLSENNFENNQKLEVIDLSNNQLQYLTSHVFDNLNRVERVNLNNNDLRSVDACIFANIHRNKLTRKNTVINLNNNPIECDCALFYLNRFKNYQLNLTCSEPPFYQGRAFDDLFREEPAYKCKYEEMDSKCNDSSHALTYLVLFIVFASLFAFFFLIACVCCIRAMKLNSKLKTQKGNSECGNRQSTQACNYVSLKTTEAN